jgi:N-acetylglucosaminyldiphosphoundecaprenol N-acetyl-beta-D-mannosaminyltransferase
MITALQAIPVRELLGVRLHAATMKQALEICADAIAERQPLQIGVLNAAKIVNMHRDKFLHDAVMGSDMILADGMSVVWASRVLGRPLPERVGGIDLFEQLLALADQRAFSVYLLGATQEVLDEVVRRIRSTCPRARIAGARNGYFSDAEAEQVADDIGHSNADMLFVAMTSPKKEIFMAKWGDRLHVPVCHGVGGSFDVMAGKVKRAPIAWQRLGMEWLYRVCQEPGRMWKRYLTTNTLFLLMLFGDFVRIRVLRRSAVPGSSR